MAGDSNARSDHEIPYNADTPLRVRALLVGISLVGASLVVGDAQVESSRPTGVSNIQPSCLRTERCFGSSVAIGPGTRLFFVGDSLTTVGSTYQWNGQVYAFKVN